MGHHTFAYCNHQCVYHERELASGHQIMQRSAQKVSSVDNRTYGRDAMASDSSDLDNSLRCHGI